MYRNQQIGLVGANSCTFGGPYNSPLPKFLLVDLVKTGGPNGPGGPEGSGGPDLVMDLVDQVDLVDLLSQVDQTC